MGAPPDAVTILNLRAAPRAASGDLHLPREVQHLTCAELSLLFGAQLGPSSPGLGTLQAHVKEHSVFSRAFHLMGSSPEKWLKCLASKFLSTALLGDFAQRIFSLWDLHNRETAIFCFSGAL